MFGRLTRPLRWEVDVSSPVDPAHTAEIHVIACGQGDTVLLRLGGDWIAIDCYIPGGATASAWEAYQAIMNDLKIQRLRALIVTHFDIDHYRGAARLLRWFVEERDGVAAVCGTASLTERAIARQLASEHRRPSERTEFGRLRDAILQHCLPEGGARLLTLHADQPPLELGRSGGGWYIGAIHPFSKRALQVAENATAKRSIDHNVLSSALMIGHRQWTHPLLLLGGDVPGDPYWSVAMNVWRHPPEAFGSDPMPNAYGPTWIKIPHHGSFTRGHSEHLFEPPPAEKFAAHALISAASARPPLPDRRTIEAYLKKGYRVWNTGLLEPLGKPATEGRSAMFGIPIDQVVATNRITVRWPDNSPSPPDAEVTPDSLDSYQQAKR
jgi:hypothetical protein